MTTAPAPVLAVPFDVLGSPGSPAEIAPGGSVAATLVVGSPTPIYRAGLVVVVAIGEEPPSAHPTVRFESSYDGDCFYPAADHPVFRVPVETPSAGYAYPYLGSPAAFAIRAVIANPGDLPIAAHVQGINLDRDPVTGR